TISAGRRTGRAGDDTSVAASILSAASIKNDVAAEVSSAPDDHFAAGPHCRVRVSARGCIGRAGGCPTIGAGIVPAASVKGVTYGAVKPAPDDHLTAAPRCRVPFS